MSLLQIFSHTKNDIILHVYCIHKHNNFPSFSILKMINIDIENPSGFHKPLRISTAYTFSMFLTDPNYPRVLKTRSTLVTVTIFPTISTWRM